MRYDVLESHPEGETKQWIEEHLALHPDSEPQPPYPRTYWARIAYVLPGGHVTHVAEGIVTETVDITGQFDQKFDGVPVCGPHNLYNEHIERM